MKERLAAALLAAAMLLCLLPRGARAQETSQYETLQIDSASLNCNAVWGLTETWSDAIMLDDSSAFYAQASGRNSGVGGLPVSGELTMPSGVPYHLAAGASATAYDGNDCIRLTADVTTAQMQLQTVGVYDNIFVLATAGGPGGSSFANFQVVLHYTDGTQESTDYKIYDWFNTGISDPNVEMYRAVMRRTSSSYSWYPGPGAYDGSIGGAPILQSAVIEADKSKLLSSVQFNLLGKGGGGNDAHGLYCGVFAVTGETPESVPNAPVATAASGTTTSGFTANWNAVDGAAGYYLDVAEDENFTQFVTGYNNSNVGNATSRAIIGVNPDATTYYYRVRAYNASGQSLSSNRIATSGVPLDYFTISFNANGGTPTPANQSVVKGGYVSEPTGVTRQAHALEGWYSDAGLTDKWAFETRTVTANATLYAKWVQNTYTITINPTSKTFEARTVGYPDASRPAAQSVEVKNTGNSPVTLNTPAANAGFDIAVPADWGQPLAAEATRSFSVRPKTGLAAGTYSAAISISTAQGTSASFAPTFVVNGALSVVIAGGLAIVSGESTELTANASGGTGNYSYAWSGGGISDTTQTVTVSPTVTTEYTVVVTDQGDSNKSATATVTVTAQDNNLAVTPASHGFGTAQTGYAAPPAAKTFTVTYTGNFWVTLREPALPQNSNYTLNSNLAGTVLTPNQSATFTVRPKPSLPAGSYNETITVDTLLSAASATFAVSFAVSDDTAAARITGHPADATVAIGSPATFTATATGYPAPDYQWQVNDGNGWDDIPGATGASYTIGSTALAMQGHQYRCVADNFTTQQNTASSNAATLTLTLPITISPGNTFVQGNAPENLTATVGEGRDIAFPADFVSATMNGQTINNSAEFDGESGSIRLKFRRDYLNTLAPGPYVLRVTVRGGAYAETRFIVTAPAAIPPTGDRSMPGLWLGLALLAGGGLFALRRRRRVWE